mmetsp:Transcript_57535/g.168493  ORF Transcript_57535/g.168493 Transcript_57535/m.168493 type:complete len:142 (-) Transcript_57535:5-430(-)
MNSFEASFIAGDGLADSWRHRRSTVRCMRYLRATELHEAQRHEVDEALNPPLALILAAAGTYIASYAGLQRLRQLRARPLVVQLAACLPAGAVLCLGGLCRSHALLRRLMDRDPHGALAVELRASCGEVAGGVAAEAAGRS